MGNNRIWNLLKFDPTLRTYIYIWPYLTKSTLLNWNINTKAKKFLTRFATYFLMQVASVESVNTSPKTRRTKSRVTTTEWRTIIMIKLSASSCRSSSFLNSPAMQCRHPFIIIYFSLRVESQALCQLKV